MVGDAVRPCGAIGMVLVSFAFLPSVALLQLGMQTPIKQNVEKDDACKRFAHVISPMPVEDLSQNVTMHSLLVALNRSQEANMDVSLFTAFLQGEEGKSPVHPFFKPLPALLRSSAEVIASLQGVPNTKKLPVLKDILVALMAHSDADCLLYSNADIGVLPDFYPRIAAKMAEGIDFLTVHRTPVEMDSGTSLECTVGGTCPPYDVQANAAVAIGKPGYPGNDMWVVRRATLAKIVAKLGDVFLGYPPVDGEFMSAGKCSGDRFALVCATDDTKSDRKWPCVSPTDQAWTFHCGLGSEHTDWKTDSAKYVRAVNHMAAKSKLYGCSELAQGSPCGRGFQDWVMEREPRGEGYLRLQREPRGDEWYYLWQAAACNAIPLLESQRLDEQAAAMEASIRVDPASAIWDQRNGSFAPEWRVGSDKPLPPAIDTARKLVKQHLVDRSGPFGPDVSLREDSPVDLSDLQRSFAPKTVAVAGLARTGSTSLTVLVQVWLVLADPQFQPLMKEPWVNDLDPATFGPGRSGVVKIHDTVKWVSEKADVFLMSHRRPRDEMISMNLSWGSSLVEGGPRWSPHTCSRLREKQELLYAEATSCCGGVPFDMELEALMQYPEATMRQVAMAMGIPSSVLSEPILDYALNAFKNHLPIDESTGVPNSDQAWHKSAELDEQAAAMEASIRVDPACAAWDQRNGTFAPEWRVGSDKPLPPAIDTASDI